MNKIKMNLQKVVNFFLASLLAVGSLPFNIINAYADDTSTFAVTDNSSDAPVNEKTLTPNGDGTYTITLNVTGKASSSTIQDVTKSNIILLIDTSGSMNGRASGYNGTRLEAEKNALTKTDGIIDKLLANNTTEIDDIIELYGINFGTGATRAWDWSTDGSSIKSAINGLTTNTGTNWEEALILAKQAADAKHTIEPDENTYIIFMTDGEPTTHQGDYTVNTNYGQEWGYASDDARAIVTAGHTFYGIFTFGSGNSSNYLKSLVNYAYTGSGTYNSSLSSDYAQYFYDATDTQALIEALEAIVDEISSSVGYTNIVMTDGLTDLTSSMKVDGKISNLTYTRSGGSYGSGTVWADAPEATTTGGTINWNLGSRVLEDGVTYSVSFVVWPDQESYDLIADLNNGKIDYDDLTASQKTSVIKNSDGSYTFKTNTDHPTLTYSTVTTTTSSAGTETVISDPTTVNITNPGPVGLAAEKLTLEKKWEDSLDSSQREEVGGEVTLNFYKDGELYQEDITLTEENNWKLDDYIAIAPGIIISNTSVIYDQLKQNHTEYSFDGKTYIILESGHDYYFDEEDINGHFELTNYIYHPMLVDNEMKNVFFTRDESGNITGIEEFKDMSSVSATNTLKGGINIEKKVVDKNGNVVDTDDSFEITAHLIDAESNQYAYDYRIYYGKNNPCYATKCEGISDSDFEKHRTGHIYGTGDLTETLYVGDVIRLVNVDSGVQYYVEETTKDGYDRKPVISYEERYGDENSTAPSVSTADGYYVVSGNTASNVTVTNIYLNEKTKVNFEKTWYDEDGSVLSGEDLPGSITIELFKKGADNKIVSTGKTIQVTADTDWKGSFIDLPKYDNGVEIVYSIKESAIEGATYDDEQKAFFEYDAEENNGKHAVTGKWTVMTFEDFVLRNTWKPATERVTGRTSFNIIKVDKDTNEPLSGATFELKLKDGTTFTTTTDVDGKAVFSNLDAGEYTLKETDAPEGYKMISTEPNINITSIKKLNTVDLVNLENIYEYVFSFSASQVSGYEYDIESRTFTVKNEQIPYIDITAAKVWDDGEDRDGLRKNYSNYYVAVKNDKDEYVAYKKLILENKDDYTFADLPATDSLGRNIEYSIIEAKDCSGAGDTIICTEFNGDENYTVTIENGVITNFHEPALYDDTGELTVQKIWDGEGNELVKPVTITIELHAETKNDEGEIKTWMVGQPVEISEANDWAWTFTDLYKYDNGLEIVYSVEESKLGETAFGENESMIIVYRDDTEIENGRWEKVISGNNITNKWTRSMAKSFTIKKTVVGLKAEVLKDLEFTVTGPEDFGEEGKMTLKIGQGCTASGYEITCIVDDKVPTGIYTVNESNAEVQNFTLTVSGDNGVQKEVNRDNEVVFEIKNEYESEKTTYRVVKIWQDGHDKDGVRPTKLAVNFLANGEVIKTKELSSDDKTQDEWGEDLENSDVWEYTFEDLPVADENAELIEYYAEEVLETDKYEQIDEISGRHTVIFVNMHEPEEDPCAKGGCGSMDIPEAPDTGRLTNLTRNKTISSTNVNMVAVAIIMSGLVLAGMGLLIKRK